MRRERLEVDKWIFHTPGLTRSDMEILGYIFSFQLRGKMCTSQNATIAAFLNMKERQVKDSLKHLSERGLIRRTKKRMAQLDGTLKTRRTIVVIAKAGLDEIEQMNQQTKPGTGTQVGENDDISGAQA